MRVDLVLDHDRRVVERAHLHHGIQHVVMNSFSSRFFSPGSMLVADVLLQILQRFKVRADQLGEVVVELGLR